MSIRQRTSVHVRIYNMCICMCRCRGYLHIIAPLCESSTIVRMPSRERGIKKITRESHVILVPDSICLGMRRDARA